MKTTPPIALANDLQRKGNNLGKLTRPQ